MIIIAIMYSGCYKCNAIDKYFISLKNRHKNVKYIKFDISTFFKNTNKINNLTIKVPAIYIINVNGQLVKLSDLSIFNNILYSSIRSNTKKKKPTNIFYDILDRYIDIK